MRQMMLMTMLVILGMPIVAMGRPVAVPNKTPSSVSARPAQAIEPDIPVVRLLIRGGTAQWAFQFACVGAHCRFRHTHVLHRFRQAQYVNLAVRFSGAPNHQGDAAMWLQRTSAKRESAEGN
jgi:hypothetical protein